MGSSPLEGRRVLDLAEGILIALRRCSVEAAFAELVEVAHRHDMNVSATAAALVNLATDANAADRHPVEAAVVQLEWGSLLAAGGHDR